MDERIQELIQQIDGYIEESKDPNFDRYLEQMKDILHHEPERFDEVRDAVARNMERYRENMKKVEEQGNQAGSEEKIKPEKNGMEYKIGVGVLSGIGILFVLSAVVILLKNFVPPVMQGLLMFIFFAVVWLVSQLVVDRKFKKLSLGLSSAGIIGLYLSTVVNYRHFETIPVWFAVGIMVAIGIISWFVGFRLKSVILQCMSFAGYLFFNLFLVSFGKSTPEFIVAIVIFIVVNLMWNLGATGKYANRVRLVHVICYVCYIAIYNLMLLIAQPEGGIAFVLCYSVVALILLNFFYQKEDSAGYFATWLIGCIIQLAYIIGIGSYMYSTDHIGVLCIFTVLVANLIILFIRKFNFKNQILYYQAACLLLFMNMWGLSWPELIATVVFFLIGFVMIKEKVLANQIVTSIFFILNMTFWVPDQASIPAILGFLLVFTMLCTYVPTSRAPKPAGLVYTNISLMGIVILISGLMEANYISNTITLVLAVAAVFILWREKCCLPSRWQGFVLTLVLAYMILVYRIQMPVVVSILLMVVALIAIIGGFVRKEKAMRIYGLVLALIVCGKVVLYDFWDLELLAKSILMLVVGVIAIAISLVYVILEHSQKKKQ